MSASSVLSTWDFLAIIVVFAGLFAVNVFLTILSRHLALVLKLVDDPRLAPNRKDQKEPVPLLGALGVVASSGLLTGLTWLTYKWNWFGLGSVLGMGLFYEFRLIWIMFGGVLIYLAGYFDDKYNLKPKLYFPILFLGLLVAVFAGGLKIESFSYPFDNLNLMWPFLPQLLASLWVGFCLAATKFLDGHDGLVASCGVVSLLSIAGTATVPQVSQPLILTLALIWACGLLGFLSQNFPEAKVYLGEGGSTIIGFVVGVLSILSGAKVATASTVLGWFILDISLVFLVRFIGTRSISGMLKGDSSLHWHHRLRALGLNKVQVLATTALVVMFSSQIGISSATQYKFWFLALQMVVMILIFTFLHLQKSKPDRDKLSKQRPLTANSLE